MQHKEVMVISKEDRNFWAEIVYGDLVLKEHEAAECLTRAELDSVEWLQLDISLLDKIRMDM